MSTADVANPPRPRPGAGSPRGEDPDVVAALVQVQREAAAELDRLTDALGQVWRQRGALLGSLDKFDAARRAALLQEMNYLNGPVTDVIRAASAMLDEGSLTDAQRFRLSFGAAAVESKYQTALALVAVVKADQ